MMDEILRKYNLKWEDLNPSERTTLFNWMGALQQQALTVEKIREYISVMKDSVEQELAETPTNIFTWFFGWRRDYLLKARLRNYTLIEALLSTPEKAKAAVERAIASVVAKK